MRWFIILGLILFNGCGKIPADPNRSLEKAKGTGLSVGYAENPPWVTDINGMPGGIEPSILNAFAGLEGIDIIWEKGPEQVLLRKLEEKKLHIVISGLTKDTPWKARKIGLTRPFYKEKKTSHIMAIQQGENRLLQALEKYFGENRDSINSIIQNK